MSGAIGKLKDRMSLRRLARREERVANVIQKVKQEQLTYLEIPALCDLAEVALNNERDGIAGIIVEAGCARGGSAIAIASAKAPGRPFFVYDLFGMIPPPSEKDGADVHERYRLIASGKAVGVDGDSYYGYENDLYGKVARTFLDTGFDIAQNNIHLVKGLYQDSMKIESAVALAHIDCDWYESVMICLNQIAPNLARGGTIIVDDYDVWSGCRKAVDEYFNGVKMTRYRFKRKSRLHIVRE